MRDFVFACHEADEAVVDLLFDMRDWRSLRVAALMVGVRDWKQYSDWMIGRIRAVGDSHDTFAMGVGVALLAAPSASDALRAEFDLGTQKKGWLLAVSTLVELDRVNGTSHSEPYVAADGPLAGLVAESQERYPNVPPPKLLPVGEVAQLLCEAREQNS